MENREMTSLLCQFEAKVSVMLNTSIVFLRTNLIEDHLIPLLSTYLSWNSFCQAKDKYEDERLRLRIKTWVAEKFTPTRFLSILSKGIS